MYNKKSSNRRQTLFIICMFIHKDVKLLKKIRRKLKRLNLTVAFFFKYFHEMNPDWFINHVVELR